ncbi:MAG: S-methyl-5-thioribose-1-phosphate isomerase [Phyllobacteriaceae bacterium]|nr:S-methyl-5-thioribose-1-phosphate isomerase [Phyllobacteriaceae bacterium]
MTSGRRPIARTAEGVVEILDQTELPHRTTFLRLTSVEAAAEAIATMRVRGAPLIGATAAYGMMLAADDDSSDGAIEWAHARLLATRPTAINLRWALDRMRARLLAVAPADRFGVATTEADAIVEEDVAICSAIGDHGLAIFEAILATKPAGSRLNVLTHCNAGRLAAVEWGTATAPIYKAHAAGLPIHVFVDETRPRNQGASLTAWELGERGVPHTVIADNAGGHLMQHAQVDVVIVGTDRTTARGDVCNKIGTYLKALAARDNGVPFYVALPSPTIDFTVADGVAEIPIEERGGEEVSHLGGVTTDGRFETIRIVPEGTAVANPAFDVTPARLVTGLLTERGVIAPNRAALVAAFPEAARAAGLAPGGTR